MSDSLKLRLFTAIELPPTWREVLGRLRADLERAASGELKWVRPDLMHLTLVFLGYQSEAALRDIIAACQIAASESTRFRLQMGRPGCFGQPRRLQVIWVGLSEVPEALARLHGAVAARLFERGVAVDSRPLVPHITVARARRSIDAVASLRAYSSLQRLAIPPITATTISAFVLMRSQLSRSGPEYEVLERFELQVREQQAASS